jgi:hypothetical protein
MATAAAPFIEVVQLASAGFAEGRSVLADAPDLRGDVGRPLLAWGHQAFTSGFIQLEALARRYISTPECAQRTPAKPLSGVRAYETELGF